MRNIISTTMMLTLLVLGGVSLSACNTIEGAGQDIENTGEAVQDAAR